MSIQYLKQNHPELYAEIHSRGVRCQKQREYIRRRRAEIRETVRSYMAEQRDYCPF